MTFRSQKLLRSANGQPCAYCGQIGTTIAAHVRSVELGSGVALKAPDFFVADLCYDCHNQVDGRAGKLSREERMDLWTRAYLRTVARWFAQGVVVVK